MVLAVLDVETTGLPQHHPYARIIEVGVAVLVNSTSLVETWHSLVHPEFRSPSEAEARAIHHISDDMLVRAPDAWTLGTCLVTWLRKRHVTHVTSYNTAFDFHPLLLGGRDWLGHSGLLLAPCLKILAAERWNDGQAMHLGEALAAASERPSNLPAHTALGDAESAAILARHLWNDLERGPHHMLSVDIGSHTYTRADYARLQAEGRVS